MKKVQKNILHRIALPIFLLLIATSCNNKPDTKRPQEPEKPFPYHVEEVTFKNEKDSLTLAGTLTMPEKEGTYPVVILISGSGAQNRNEEVFGHKPFLVIADYFTRPGIAVLRYDDRGFGKSTGDYQSSTLIDFSKDVESAISFLKTRPNINPNKIGLVGHSEGALVGAITASKSDDVSFLVSMAGPGQSVDKLFFLQHKLMSQAKGIPKDKIARCLKIEKKLFELVKSSTNVDTLKKQLTNHLEANYKDYHFLNGTKGSLEEKIKEEVNFYTSISLVDELKNFTPSTYFKKVKCPVLALGGSKDLHVPTKENIEAIKKALEEGENYNVTTKIFPNLNHFFQECTTGLPSEIEQIEQTISPLVLEEMATWIASQTK